MSEKLQARAEILKLARLLERDPESLDYLQEIPVADLRRLRQQVTEVLFSAHNQLLSRLARASRLLPTPLVASIGERAFGPLLSARLAALLDPVRAVEMAGKLPVSFLADVAVQLDPRRASGVIAGMPPPAIAEITRELLARGEHVTMGSFVGHLGPDAIRAAIDQMDDAALLQVAFVLESKDSLQGLIELLPGERIDGIIDAAAREDLWPEVLDLLSHLDTEQTRRLADAAAAREEAVLSSLILSTQEHDIWAAALPVTSAMSEVSRRRFAELPAIQAEGVLERIVSVAREYRLWPHLLPLIPFLPEAARRRVGDLVEGLDLGDEELARLAELTATFRARDG